MAPSTASSPARQPVIQFSVFADNKVGQLNDLLLRLARDHIHVLALSIVDINECTVMRMVPNYPDETRQLLRQHNYPFAESSVLAVELHTEAQLPQLSSALLQAEVNIHYLYPFLMRPENRIALVLNLDDPDFARTLLQESGIRTLDRQDLAR